MPVNALRACEERGDAVCSVSVQDTGTQVINVLRGHLTEFGQGVSKGASNVAQVVKLVEDVESGLPAQAVATLEVLVDVIAGFDVQSAQLDIEIRQRARENETARRLMTISGISPLIATAIVVLTLPPETFRRGRDFAAWLDVSAGVNSAAEIVVSIAR